MKNVWINWKLLGFVAMCGIELAAVLMAIDGLYWYPSQVIILAFAGMVIGGIAMNAD